MNLWVVVGGATGQQQLQGHGAADNVGCANHDGIEAQGLTPVPWISVMIPEVQGRRAGMRWASRPTL